MGLDNEERSVLLSNMASNLQAWKCFSPVASIVSLSKKKLLEVFSAYFARMLFLLVF